MKGKHFGRRLLAMVTLLAVLCAAVPSALATEAGYGLMDTFQDYYAQVGAEEETPDEPEQPEETPDEPETKEDDPEDETEDDESKDDSKDDETPDQPADDAETDEDEQIAEAFDKMTSLFSTQAETTGTAVAARDTFYYDRGFYSDPDHKNVVSGTVVGKPADNGATTLQQFTAGHPNSVIYMDCTYKQVKDETISNVTLYYNFGKKDAWENQGMFRMEESCTLTLDNVEIDGQGDNYHYSERPTMLINAAINPGSKVVIQGNTKIHNIQFESDGAGLINANKDSTSIIMENGEIYNISGSKYVFIARNIEIKGGKIHDNKTEKAIIATADKNSDYQGTYIAMSGGLIENNTLTDSNPQYKYGAYYTQTFTMTGGTVRNTTSTTKRDAAWPLDKTEITGGNPGRIRTANDGEDQLSSHDIAVQLSKYGLSGDSGLNKIVLMQIASPNVSDPEIGTLSEYGTTGLLPDSGGTVYLWDGFKYGVKYGESSNTLPYKEVAYIKDSTEKDHTFITLLGCTGSGTDIATVTGQTLTVGQTLGTCFTSERIENKIFTSDYLEWQYSDDDGKTWVSTGKDTLTTTAADANKKYRVAMTNSASYDQSLVKLINEVASKVYTVNVPQISVTVPTTLLVNVKPDGTCEVQGKGKTNFVNGTEGTPDAAGTTGTANGTILNNSTMDVYLTGVTFTWNTDGGQDADGNETPAPSEIFTNWKEDVFSSRPQMTLAVKGNTATAESPNEAENSITWKLSAATGKIDAATGDDPGKLPLTWSFDLSGNAISQALQAGVAAPIGVITYEVSYKEPAA